MKKILIPLLFFVLSSAHADSAKLSLSESGYNFGTISEGTVVGHEFSIENKGESDLIIQKIVPSCGCTAATLSSNTIKPKASEKIKVTFDTSGFKGDKTRTVELITNDPTQQQVTITIKGSVKAPAKIEPLRLDFGELSAGSSDLEWSKNFKVDVDSDSSYLIKKVSSPSKFIKIYDISSASNHKNMLYKAIIDKAAPRGEFRDRIVIELSGSKASDINLPVLAILKGDLRLNPSTISFGVITSQKVLERTVKIENKANSSVNITNIESDSNAIETELKELKAGESFMLRIKLLPSKIDKDLRATVKIQTDHPDEKELLLNVYAAVPLN